MSGRWPSGEAIAFPVTLLSCLYSAATSVGSPDGGAGQPSAHLAMKLPIMSARALTIVARSRCAAINASAATAVLRLGMGP